MPKKHESSADVRRRILKLATSIVPKKSNSSVVDDLGSKSHNISFNGLERVIERNSTRKINNRIILESSSNLERGLDIITGLIANPNGGSATILNYTITASKEDYSEIEANLVLEELRKHFTNDIGFHNKIYKLIYKVLATDGADVEVYLQDDVVSRLLHSESLAGLEADDRIQLTKLTANPKKKDKDSEVDLFTVTSDAFELLKPDITEKQMVLAGLEADKSKSKNKTTVKNILSRRLKLKSQRSVDLTAVDMSTETTLIVKNIPPEAVAPIHLSGVDGEPFRYTILLDVNTSLPVEVQEDFDFVNDFKKGGGEDSSANRFRVLGSSLKMKDFRTSNVNTGIDSLYATFRENVVNKLTHELLNDKYVENYKITQDNQLIDIMFHNFLRGRQTKMLTLEPEMVSYIAVNKDKLGIGQSLLNDISSLALMHLTLFHAKFLQDLDGSIPRKELEVDMDEYDQDKEKTLEMIVSEFAETQKPPMTWDAKSSSGLLDGLFRHGLRVKVNNAGIGSDIPNLQLQLNDIQRKVETIDVSLLEKLDKMLTHKIKLAADVVDNSNSPDFSSQVVRDNEISDRQIAGYISSFNECFSDRGVKRVLNNKELMNKLTGLLKGDNAQEKLETMLVNFNITLPTIETNVFEANLETIEKLSTTIDTILNNTMGDWISDSLIDGGIEEIKVLREIVKSSLLRDYIMKNTAFRGLIETVSSGDIESIISGEYEIAGKIGTTLAGNYKTLAKTVQRMNAKKEKIDASVGVPVEEQPPVTPTGQTTPAPKVEGDGGLPNLDIDMDLGLD